MVIYVCAGADPLDDAAFDVAHSRCTTEVPAVLAVRGAPEAALYLERPARAAGLAPDPDAPLQVVRVQHLPPAPALGLLDGHAGVVAPALVVVVNRAVGVRRPDDLRHRVGQLVVALLAGPRVVERPLQGRLRPLAPAYVSHHAARDEDGDGGCDADGQHDQGEGEPAGRRVARVTILYRPAHLLALELREGVPGAVIFNQARERLSDYRGPRLFILPLVDEEVERPLVALDVRHPRLFRGGEQFPFPVGLKARLELHDEAGDLLAVLSPACEERVNLLPILEEENPHRDPVVKGGVVERLRRQTELVPAPADHLLHVRVYLGHAVQPQPAHADQDDDQEGEHGPQPHADALISHDAQFMFTGPVVPAPPCLRLNRASAP